MVGFEGIPAAAADFFAELELNNNRAWWTAHRDRYESLVRLPMTSLGEALEPEYGPAKVFRPHRDVRFSPDKSPFKTHQGLVIPTRTGMGWYVQISARGLMVAGGWYAASPDQLARYRSAVDDDANGERLVQIVADVHDAAYEVSGDLLTTRPRGVPANHPRLELLRHKSMTVAAEHGLPVWLETAAVLDQVRSDWAAFTPLMAWLDEHVGDSESTPPPPGRRGARTSVA